MRMVRWMCGVKLKDRLPSKELRERLGVDDIALILQQNRLRWYGHVLSGVLGGIRGYTVYTNLPGSFDSVYSPHRS